MQLAVFGGTGRTGRRLVELALARGHRVFALCRTASAMPLQHPNLKVIEGTLTNPLAVDQAIAGSSAVVILFGPRPRHSAVFCSAATVAILDAMRRCRVRRVVCVTGALIGEGVQRSWAFEQVARFFRRRMPAFAADRTGQEQIIQTSGLDWTLVKPPRLTDSPGIGRLTAGSSVRVGLLSKISREDLARFILDQVDSAENVGRTVVIRH